jgi:hypothetical protein
MPVDQTLTLSGDPQSCVAQLLRIAQQQAILAQTAAAPRMQDALAELEDALADHLAALSNAAEADQSDAEASGAAERERRSWRPLRAA